MLGKSFSKIIEPILIDNIIKEKHNRTVPIFFSLILLIINIVGIFVLRDIYLISTKLLETLTTSINGTILMRLYLLILHGTSILSLPIALKFVGSYDYKHKALSYLFLILTVIGIIHFAIFLITFTVVLF